MGIIGQQFGSPTGAVGSLVGRFMARNNAALNRWVATQVAEEAPHARRLIEIGSGPGVGTQAILQALQGADLVAVDPSPAMHRQLLRRNRAAVRAGRVRVVTGGLDELGDRVTADVVVGVHVVYFWPDTVEALRQVSAHLEPGGLVALGYQLRSHMPGVAQRDFPASGHRLFEADDDLTRALRAADLAPLQVRVLGDSGSPVGRLALAVRSGG